MNVFFYLSSDVQYNVAVKISAISNLPSISELTDIWRYSSATIDKNEYECFIECSLFQKGRMLGLPLSSSYKQFSSSRCSWNEYILFPVRICDISRDAQIVFTIYFISFNGEYNGSSLITTIKHIIGGVTIPLFEKQKILRFGHYKLRIKEGYHGDGCIDSSTLFTKLNRHLTVCDEIQSKITQRAMKEIPKVPYLDNITNRRLNKNIIYNTHNVQNISDCIDGIYLEIDFPNIGHKVVYQEKRTGKKTGKTMMNNCIESGFSALLLLNDPELKLINPVLHKNNKLQQHLDLYDDHDSRPNVDEQKRLQEIIKLFDISTISEIDKLLLWKYRKYLINNKYALTKFLRIINESNENEIDIALNLMDKWVPIDIASALELLSGHFTCPQFRKYGIDILRKTASDQDLELYIMQLVQAIRFESWSDKTDKNELSELETFLLDRCLNSDSFSLLNFLFWSVNVASNGNPDDNDDDDVDGDIFNERYLIFLQQIKLETKLKRSDYFEELQRQKWLIQQLIELSQFIENIEGKVDDKKKKLKYTLSNGKYKYLNEFKKGVLMPLRPNIRITGIEGNKCSVFQSAMKPLKIVFKFEKDKKYKSLSSDIKNDGDDEEKKEKKEKNEKNENNKKRERTQLTDLDNDPFYTIMWKNGDDLRRDQLIIQMIHLMDNLLMDVNLNLYLTPYPVLATGLNHGMVEFVPYSPTIGGILKDYNNNISLFLEDKSNGNIQELELMTDRFIKSLAGYCIITYLLGVGDRHLDNILLTNGGYLFHIDFGYIYGEEPPFKTAISPKIRIIKQMIDVMGGCKDIKYSKFQNYIRTSYGRLRKMAPLILNLLSLIGQGSMQKIEDNINFVYSRFNLELNEIDATNQLLTIIKESANSFWTSIFIDAPHNYATKHK